MIHRVELIRRTKEATTQAACAGNDRGYEIFHSVNGILHISMVDCHAISHSFVYIMTYKYTN